MVDLSSFEYMSQSNQLHAKETEHADYKLDPISASSCRGIGKKIFYVNWNSPACIFHHIYRMTNHQVGTSWLASMFASMLRLFGANCILVNTDQSRQLGYGVHISF